MVGRLCAELDFNAVVVEIRVGLGARQRRRIDVRPNHEACTPRSGDSRKYPGTGTYVQNGGRLTLPAEQVEGCRTQARGCVRTVPKYGRRASS
jgi:hypothetical protein